MMRRSKLSCGVGDKWLWSCKKLSEETLEQEREDVKQWSEDAEQWKSSCDKSVGAVLSTAA